MIAAIAQAEARIRSHTLTTPLMVSKPLSKEIGGTVYLKLESEQHTGSFKARGSLNKILALSEAEKQRGIVTASTGNHALGVARALEIGGVEGTIYLPKNAAKSKVEALAHYAATLKFYDGDSLATELHAKEIAAETGRVWISPYNDPEVIAGQGTIGVELVQQAPSADAVLVTMGGGGLIAGIGLYLKKHWPDTQIIGCQPENSPEMTRSLEAGEIVVLDQYQETLSDGSAGGVEPDAITFSMCQDVVDACILVSEAEIRAALRWMGHHHHKIIEGAAAVPLAALRKHADRFHGKTVILIICGANIDADLFKQIL